MNFGTPRWWYEEHASGGRALRLLLTPFSFIWAEATRRRLDRGPAVDPGAPVICVGNLTMGGAGKTPVARAILAALAAKGLSAAALTRGYGGKQKGPLLVDAQTHTAADVGDEPLLLATVGPTWVSRDRRAGAKAAVDAGAGVIVMDDGHQNPTLQKALSLIVVDGETRSGEWPFGDGAVFPAGPMREPLLRGLSRSDAVVLMLPADMPHADMRLLALFQELPVLIARLTPLQAPPRGPQFGFAGIAKPWKVERSLKAAGCELVDFAPFPDHAAYSEADLSFLATRAATLGAGLVTTEKDWVRLPPEWRARVTPWPVAAVFEDPCALDRLLDQAISMP